MASYAIGDIQGCFTPFQQLLRKIEFNPGRDNLWLTGDVVNRGPESLAVLRWLYAHQDCVQLVLGNHDLHLLAVSEGFGKLRTNDTLLEILNATDGKLLLDWLRCQPLMVTAEGYTMVHAGLLPEWTIDRALNLASEVENALSGPKFRALLARLYGNKPTRWNEEIRGHERLRIIVNAMTRMRLVTHDGAMDFSFKGKLADAPAHLLPWFAVAQRRSADMPIICGHWSALGLFITEDILAIDTGCIWGGSLTALRLADRQLFSLECLACRTSD